jgi:hypothetical protein
MSCQDSIGRQKKLPTAENPDIPRLRRLPALAFSGDWRIALWIRRGDSARRPDYNGSSAGSVSECSAHTWSSALPSGSFANAVSG